MIGIKMPSQFDDNQHEYWYRYHDYATTGGVRVALQTFKVIRHTPKGVQLDLGLGESRFVLQNARKRFACPKKDEALDSFKARKRRQKRLLEHQLRRVNLALNAVERDDCKASDNTAAVFFRYYT